MNNPVLGVLSKCQGQPYTQHVLIEVTGQNDKKITKQLL